MQTRLLRAQLPPPPREQQQHRTPEQQQQHRTPELPPRASQLLLRQIQIHLLLRAQLRLYRTPERPPPWVQVLQLRHQRQTRQQRELLEQN